MAGHGPVERVISTPIASSPSGEGVLRAVGARPDFGHAEVEGLDLGGFHGTSRMDCRVDTGGFGTHDALHHTTREGVTAERLAAAPKAGGLYRGETKVRGLLEPVMPEC